MPFAEAFAVADPRNIECYVHVSILIEGGTVGIFMIVAAKIETVNALEFVGSPVIVSVLNSR